MVRRISLKDLEEGNYEALKLALHNNGAFILTESDLGQTMASLDSIALSSFFQGSEEDKQEFSISGSGMGYIPLKGEALGRTSEPLCKPDYKESFNIRVKEFQNQANYPDSISQLTKLIPRLEHLSFKLIQAFENSLAMPPNWIQESMEQHDSIFRVAYSPPLQDHSEPTIRVGEHTDYGILTILKPFEQNPCLEIYSHESNSWEIVKIPQDGLVINAGDLIQIFSNQKWLACKHRVIVPQEPGEERLSLVYFCNPRKSAIITPYVEANSSPSCEAVTAGNILSARKKYSVDSIDNI